MFDLQLGSQVMDDRRKNYRLWDAQQNCQGSVSPRDALPEDDLVFFLIDLIPQMDLTRFHQYYARDLRGQPPFDVTMMVTLLVYAYSVGGLLQPKDRGGLRAQSGFPSYCRQRPA
jgi:hypothetical protein